MRILVAAFALLVALPAHAQEWWEAETEHFIVKSRSNQQQAKEFAEELERYDGALRTLQNIAADSRVSRANKVTIFRFGDQGHIAHMAGASGSGIAGFYISRAGNSVAYVPAREEREAGSKVRRDERTSLDGMSVLKHEYAHHFMMQYFPAAYPRWYVEGYAEMVATMRFLDDGSFHVGDPPQYRAYQVMRMPAFRLKEMLDASHELTGFQGLQHYGTGWLLTHYLNFDDEGRANLVQYLRALSGGEDSLEAAERIFGDLGTLDRKLSTYRRGNFPGFNVKPANYTPPVVEMRRMAADEVAFIQQKMELWRGIRKKDAAGIANQINGIIAQYSDSLEGQLLLAEVSFDGENYAAAASAAERAVELDPKAIRGWLYRGKAATELAKADPSTGLDAKAREYFIVAAGIDPEDPRPLIEYYRTYLAMGQEVPEDALIGLERAFDFAGSDSEYRFLLTRQLLSEGRFEDARTVVMPAVFQGHATGEADADEGDPTPQRLLNLINSKDANGAIAMIDKILDPEDEDDKA